jgi:DNA-binding PadR family transcriptional regulator
VDDQPTLTTTSYVALGLLARRSRTAYALVQELRGTLGHVWPRGTRALYDEPRRLVLAGLATATPGRRGRRPHTTYAATDAGRAALAAWLRTAVSPTQLTADIVLRALFADHGTTAQLRRALEDVRAQAVVDRIELGRRLLDTPPHPDHRHLDALATRFLADHLDTTAVWAAWALRATAGASDPSTPTPAWEADAQAVLAAAVAPAAAHRRRRPR